MRLVWDEPVAVAAWTRARIPGITDWGPCAAIGVADGCRPLAGIVYSGFRPGVSIDMSVAAEPGAMWLSRAALAALFGFPFHQLGVGRVQSFIAEGNERSETLCRRLGFTHEGTMREGWDDQRDLKVFGLLKRECIWIRKRVCNG